MRVKNLHQCMDYEVCISNLQVSYSCLSFLIESFK
jgi:hypothetical protein